MTGGILIYIADEFVSIDVVAPDVEAARTKKAAEKAAHAENVTTRGVRAYRRNHPEYSDNGVDKGWNYESLVKHGGPYNGRTLARIAAEAAVEYAEACVDAANDAASRMRAADPLAYSSDHGYIEA